jgi:hypothetical protein
MEEEEEEEENSDNFHHLDFPEEGTAAYGFDSYGCEYGEGGSGGLPLVAAPAPRHATLAAAKVDTRSGGDSSRFQCALCLKRYKSAGSLQNHRSIYHRNEIGKHQKSFLGATAGAWPGPAIEVGSGAEGHSDFTASEEWRPK